MIKKLSCVMLMCSSSVVMAHPGHGMSDNNWHSVFHLMFWLLVAVVAYKGYQWWRQKKAQSSAD